mgnify:CR=1 FL=1
MTPSRRLVDADKLDSVPRFAAIDKVIGQDDLDTPRQLPGRRTLRHLLNVDRLVVSEGGQTVLHNQWVPIAVILWNDGGGSGERR